MSLLNPSQSLQWVGHWSMIHDQRTIDEITSTNVQVKNEWYNHTNEERKSTTNDKPISEENNTYLIISDEQQPDTMLQ